MDVPTKKQIVREFDDMFDRPTIIIERRSRIATIVQDDSGIGQTMIHAAFAEIAEYLQKPGHKWSDDDSVIDFTYEGRKFTVSVTEGTD